ncbi:hypothetical protein [Micromonospora sp. WMMD980]|uniref:hypothetical protein n=1 Tax=Micromonospora sp. WMMD980 TaxID=3016088 RepID=UPI002415D987|nr:hypothetical protein [Micromonospora sp. WMMD980]MDG4801718.1 hypothetical protein [Micromonospora sp. WMMD980]
MAAKIRLDHRGILAVLKSSEVAAEVGSLAETIRGAAAAHPSVVEHEMHVKVSTYTTDRAAAAVDIAHPGGVGVQAKHGVLTQAAGAAALEVRET